MNTASHTNVDFGQSLPLPPTISNDCLPQPYTGSGQLKGETLVEFFQRRDAKNLERMRTETAKQMIPGPERFEPHL